MSAALPRPIPAGVRLALVLAFALGVAVAWFLLRPNSRSVASQGAERTTATANSATLTLPANEELAAEPAISSAATASRATPEQLVAEIHRLLAPGAPIDRNRLIQELLPRLVAIDPIAATTLLGGIEAGPLREEMVRQLARLLSASDIHTALAWLTRLPEPDRKPAAEAVIAQVSQTDPAGALGVASTLGVGLDDGRQEHLMQLWTEEKPTDALAWVTTQPATPERDRLLARAIHVRAQQDPADAVRLTLAHIPAGSAQDEALLGVIRQWAIREPAAAAEWVRNLPHGPLLSRAQAELALAMKQR